jgi:hypothetical protein
VEACRQRDGSTSQATQASRALLVAFLLIARFLRKLAKQAAASISQVYIFSK